MLAGLSCCCSGSYAAASPPLGGGDSCAGHSPRRYLRLMKSASSHCEKSMVTAALMAMLAGCFSGLADFSLASTLGESEAERNVSE